MILLVSRRHVGAQSDVHRHGVSTAYLSPFIFQILDFIYFYYGWRDSQKPAIARYWKSASLSLISSHAYGDNVTS